ncbi:ShlB/FhaC/HecB family hemolysin secretion/activation protein [Agarivorans sp. Alg241-V36]|uniref:ShlB/FhaC/HecB family hemolysin secretion/activation protein n=1 Tax=Agarivorans sp. Alg241-V36 TaxID=2305992 RepID=UPI0013D6C1E3|nr:ShlB/FhaC/HecB family hemolysin secretion/activation protein [Agarivorans sp. Alg241-V36]
MDVNKLVFLRRFGCSLFIAFYMDVSAAEPPFSLPLSPNDQSAIESVQKEQLEQQLLQQEKLKSLTSLPEIEEQQFGDDGTCFAISEIRFQGASLLSKHHQRELTSNIDLSCVGLTHINQLLKDVTQWYLSKGYVTSRAYLSEQDLSSGVLVITVMEGRIESVSFRGIDTKFHGWSTPAKSGDILNLRDIEQGLDQLNRLQRYQVSIDLKPGSKASESKVYIDVQDLGWLHLRVTLGNSGQESTGEEQLALGANFDDLIGISESWKFNFSTALLPDKGAESENILLGFDVPFGYWTMNYQWNRSAYQYTFNPFGFDMKSNGNSHNHRWMLHRNFFRDDRSKWGARLSVNHRRDDNYLQGLLLTSSTRELSSLELSLETSQRFGNLFSSANLAWRQGSSLFGAETDENKGIGVPKAEFNKASIQLSLSAVLPSNWTYQSSLFYQYSPDMLYGTERTSIGGQYSVRGFKGKSISGDKGGYFRNSVDKRLPLLQGNSWLSSFSLGVGLDAGLVANNASDNFSEGHLVGTSVALKAQGKNQSSQLTVGAPLWAPEWLKADDWVMYWELAVQI